ncbi:MAG: UDP-N-acetylmuramate dehydrogenase [Candidatus Eisenbacteria bacterium]|uniref:UDP-N-acetylenolpyruvoylglucosamine reductase n=1 Tax=Eiseniibacteriota bacterium TaxID=2212470 RepID=A0A937XA94_UNCEI|nr:UDP-N-acetylmuramate dehydrogenase [Candidatus Eisenbacteria bacterium]
MGLAVPSRWAQDVPLTQLTTWRIGGPARYVSRPPDLSALRDDLRIARGLALPLFVVGAGANLLFPDRGYPGLIVRLPSGPPRFCAGPGEAADAAASQGALCAPIRATLPAGAPLGASAHGLAEQGYAGLEWAEGIPGTLGGAVVNNAGAYGGDMAGVVEGVEMLGLDGRLEPWPAERLQFGYRRSALKGQEPTRRILAAVHLRLSTAPPAALAQRVADYRARREARTPCGASCGCVFRNPPGEPAGRLIERAGLAGRSVGDARVAEGHANYIVNHGRARAADVLKLLRLIRERVREESGVALELEVQLVGFPQAVQEEFA